MDNCHTIPTKWTKIILSVFGLTILLAVFSLYRFYVTAPYAFADKEQTMTQLSLLQQEVRLNQERYKFVQDAIQTLTDTLSSSTESIQDQLEDLKKRLPEQQGGR